MVRLHASSSDASFVEKYASYDHFVEGLFDGLRIEEADRGRDDRAAALDALPAGAIALDWEARLLRCDVLGDTPSRSG